MTRTEAPAPHSNPDFEAELLERIRIDHTEHLIHLFRETLRRLPEFQESLASHYFAPGRKVEENPTVGFQLGGVRYVAGYEPAHLVVEEKGLDGSINANREREVFTLTVIPNGEEQTKVRLAIDKEHFKPIAAFAGYEKKETQNEEPKPGQDNDEAFEEIEAILVKIQGQMPASGGIYRLTDSYRTRQERISELSFSTSRLAASAKSSPLDA